MMALRFCTLSPKTFINRCRTEVDETSRSESYFIMQVHLGACFWPCISNGATFYLLQYKINIAYVYMKDDRPFPSTNITMQLLLTNLSLGCF